MMVKLETFSGRVLKYAVYIVAALLAFFLAFLNTRSENSSHQLLGNGLGIGTTAYADAPGGGSGAGSDGSDSGGSASSGSAGSGTSGEGGTDGGSSGTGGGTGGD